MILDILLSVYCRSDLVRDFVRGLDKVNLSVFGQVSLAVLG